MSNEIGFDCRCYACQSAVVWWKDVGAEYLRAVIGVPARLPGIGPKKRGRSRRIRKWLIRFRATGSLRRSQSKMIWVISAGPACL